MKIYKKRGPQNYSEKRMVRQLEEFFGEQLSKDPNFMADFRMATSPEELKAMHQKYCVTDVEIISETKTDTSMAKGKGDEEHILSNEKEVNLNATKSDLRDESISFDNPDEETIDPMNRANPKVRDYVMNDSMNPNDKKGNEEQNTSFAEPLNADEAFTLPQDDEKDFTGGGGSGAGKKTKEKKDQPDTYNPDFNDMKTGSKNKKTKRMAKYIIRGFCTILEKGVPFLATRDITPIALAKMAKTKQLDMSVILQLDNETQVSIVEYFTYMREQAKQLGVIPQELQDDLIDDLYDFLMEKGITPTPTQSLMMGLMEIGLIVGLKTLEFRGQISQAMDIARPVKAEKNIKKEAETIISNLKKEETTSPVENVEEEEEEDDLENDDSNNEEEFAEAGAQKDNLPVKTD